MNQPRVLPLALLLTACSAPVVRTTHLADLGLTVRFDDDGAALRRDNIDVLTIRTSAWGRPNALEPFRPGSPAIGITEWWTILDLGVEQGWTLDESPPGDGPLLVDVQVDGAAQIAVFGAWGEITDAEGRAWRVDHLAAWDADGDPLPARFLGLDQGLRIEVDDTGARFPITIDPAYTTAAWSVEGEAGSNGLGTALSAAGDVNGDGFGDVVVGAPGYSSNTGRVYVYLGSALGLATSPDTVLTGEAVGDTFGASVSDAGDVNADGYDDVVIGADRHNSATGRAYVFLGSAAGVDTTAATTLDGEAEGDHFGTVSGGGDVNGDGYDDVIVGARDHAESVGGAYVYEGSPSGIGVEPAVTLTYDGAAEDFFGCAVSGAGDVNGDGFDDVIVGAYGYRIGEDYDDWVGQALVYYGSATGLDVTAGETRTGNDSDATYFGWAVADAGDVNGDGYGDVIVGGSYRDAAVVFLGSSSGLATSGTSLTSGDWYDFGASVSSAGDVNQDGYADVIVGAYSYTYGEDSFGGAQIFEGSAGGVGTTATTVLPTPELYDPAYAVVSGVGDVNGDGADDVIVGAPTYDADAGRADVYYGYALTDVDGDGVFTEADCDDAAPNTFPGAAAAESSTACMNDDDDDGFGDVEVVDGVAVGTDCDDDDPRIFPGATETDCADPIDYNCDGSAGDVDADADGFSACTECQDNDGSVHPGATESPGDAIDQDCDGTELCLADADEDGYGAADGSVVVGASLACTGPGEAAVGNSLDDCDDTDDDVNPGEYETVGTGIDENCDGAEYCYDDLDADGYTSGDYTLGDADCDDPFELIGSSRTDDDCDDADPARHPGADEACNGIDDDCDDEVDEKVADPPTWYADRDGDGFTNPDDDVTECPAPEGYIAQTEDDCDDDNATVFPGAPEIPPVDGIDQDCDGVDAFRPREPGCGCPSATGGVAWLWLGAGVVAGLRRRRPS